MTILCGTDFSPVAARATAVAAEWADRLALPLELLHAVPAAVLPYEFEPDSAVLVRSLKQASERELAKAVSPLLAPGRTVDSRTQVGAAEDVLTARAQELKARMVVVGTRGRSGAARLLLGSVAERLVRQAGCPVLVVPEPSTEGFLAGTRRDGPLKIMVGLDRSRASDAAVDWVRELRKQIACDVTFVHVFWPPREHSRLGIAGPYDDFGDDPEVSDVIRREMEFALGERGFPSVGPSPAAPGTPGATTLRLHPTRGREEEPLAGEAVTDHVDLLVIGTAQHRGTWSAGSTALGIVRVSKVPVLCIPAAPAQAAAAAGKDRIAPLAHVLAPTDLSDVGNSAVPQAYRLLRAGGGVVDLLHVHDSIRHPLTPEQQVAVERQLRALIPEEAERRGIRTRISLVEHAMPTEAILQASERLGVDTVVMASHGRGGISRAVLGSVTDAVVRSSNKPVFVIGPGERAS